MAGRLGMETPSAARVHRQINSILKSQGYNEYVILLKEYILEITEMDGVVAYIDVEHGRIVVHKTILDKDANTKSMIIRHEVLHAYLKHIEREISMLAARLGFDKKALTELDMETIYKEMGKTSLSFRQYGNAKLGNIAADLDLSKYYTQLDVEVARSIGGLIILDYPEYKKIPFEQLYAKIEADDRRLNRRFRNKIYGTYDDNTGEFIVDHEEKSEFYGNELDKDDLINFRLPTSEEVMMLHKSEGAETCWVSDEIEDADTAHFLATWWRTPELKADSVTSEFAVYVVCTDRVLDMYSERNSNIFKLGTTKWLRIGNRTLITLKPICESEWNPLGKTSDYKGSVIEAKINKFVKGL